MSHYCERKSCLGKKAHLSRNCPHRKRSVAAKAEAPSSAQKKQHPTHSPGDPALWKPVRANGTRECLKCTLTFKVDRTGKYATVAHWVERGGWCRAGRPPTELQRATRKKKRSVRAVSGGLPTLGK